MILDIAVCLLVFIVGYFISVQSRERHGPVYSNYLLLLWLFHLAITIVFYFFIVNDTSSDSMRFWRTAQRISSRQAFEYLFSGRGTNFMFAVCYPLTKLGLTFFTGTVIFSLLGFIAVQIFFRLSKMVIPVNSKFLGVNLFPWIFFLPNLHFWSAGIGKDTLVLLGVALFSLGVFRLKVYWLYLLMGILITLLIRPHITLMLFIAYGIIILFGSKIKTYYKIPIFVLIAVGAVFVLPKVLEITGMEEASVEQYSEFSTTKATKLSEAHTGSAIDIASYPFPLKVFSFLFRPTFIDISGIPALVAAFENLILLLLTLKIIFRRPVSSYYKAPPLAKYLLIFLAVGTVLFSLTLGNLGIMLRMRNMFLPGFLLYILWGMSYIRTLDESDLQLKKPLT